MSHWRLRRPSWQGPRERAPRPSAGRARGPRCRPCLMCGWPGRCTAMAGMWTAGRLARICTRRAGGRFFRGRREARSARSLILSSHGLRPGRRWRMMPQPRTCKQPRPWSPVPSRCPSSTASRTTQPAASVAGMPGSVSMALSFRTRPAHVRMSGRVSPCARSRRRGTSPCSRQMVRRAARTRASPGIACRASLPPSSRARWTIPSRPTWLLPPAAGCCQRPGRQDARAFTTRWVAPPGCSLPSATPRPASRSQGSKGPSVRWYARANRTSRIRRRPERNRGRPERHPGSSREQ